MSSISTRVKVSEYNVLGPLCKGGQGDTLKAVALLKNGQRRVVVIKRMERPFDTIQKAKYAYREFALLSSTKHPNLVALFDVLTTPERLQSPSLFREVSFVTEYGGNTLHQVVEFRRANCIQWAHEEISLCIYQVLCALNYLHKANVMHRDLKPDNIAMNDEGRVKVLDYGCARALSLALDTQMTPELMVPFYRAPEIFLGIESYGSQVDLWSVGCILAELLRDGQMLFTGSDFYTQWPQYVESLGTPNLECFGAHIPPVFAQEIANMPPCEAKAPEEYLPERAVLKHPEMAARAGINVQNARELVTKLLKIDPEERLRAGQALGHPYLVHWLDQSACVQPEGLFDFSEEEQEANSTEAWRDKLFAAVDAFRKQRHHQKGGFMKALANKLRTKTE